jgi:glycosyltransferase involved in cell wall biosynthesis
MSSASDVAEKGLEAQGDIMPDTNIPAGIREELDLTLFVACYNEERRVEGTLDTIRAAHAQVQCSYEVIVVDDGSKDNTCAVVEAYAASHLDFPVRLHRNSRNLGLARSFVETAFLGRGRYYRLVCGDNVEPVETMIILLRKMGQADLVLPYYPILPGKSFVRRTISKTFTFMVDLLSGYSIIYYNGCALYRRFHVMRWAPYNYGFGFQADLITMLLDEGCTYIEVPVSGSHFVKEGGRSPLNFRNFISTGHTLFEIFLRRIRRTLFNVELKSGRQKGDLRQD